MHYAFLVGAMKEQKLVADLHSAVTGHNLSVVTFLFHSWKSSPQPRTLVLLQAIGLRQL